MLLENNLSDAIAEFSEGEKKMKQYLRIESITDLMGLLLREEVVHPLVTLVNFDDYKSQLPIGTKVILAFMLWYWLMAVSIRFGMVSVRMIFLRVICSVSLPDKQLPLEQMNRK